MSAMETWVFSLLHETVWRFSGLEFMVFFEEVKNNLGFLFVCLFLWLGLCAWEQS